MNRITFWGAARTVTGSKHLIETAKGQKILLDCGMFQGLRENLQYNKHFGFSPAEVEAVILTHAHIDHSGLIPRLCREGFSGKIFCTPATQELTRLMLYDSAKIQEEDTRFVNKYREKEGIRLVEPLYTTSDVTRCLIQFKSVDFFVPFEVLEGVYCTFTVAGHILGSAVANITLQGGEGQQIKICYSGDLGRYDDEVMLAPGQALSADYIICETTYGDRLHLKDFRTEEELLNEIEYTCLIKKGVLVIPAFSVGRTQGLLYHLNSLFNSGRLPPIDIFVDSPMAREATDIVRRFPHLYNEQVRGLLEKDSDVFGFPGLFFINNSEDSKRLNERNEPFVVISASGMADAGRVKHHIRHRISDRKNTILFTGYSEPETLGGKLSSGQKKVKIYGEELDVRCEVHKLQSMSAHGDVHDLLTFLEQFDPRKVKRLFLVHGSYDAQEHFGAMCRAKGFLNVDIPERGAIRTLD